MQPHVFSTLDALIFFNVSKGPIAQSGLEKLFFLRKEDPWKRKESF